MTDAGFPFSAKVERELRALATAYGVTEDALRQLILTWDFVSSPPTDFLTEVSSLLSSLSVANDRFVRRAVLQVVADEWKVADGLVGRELPMTISRATAARVRSGFYRSLEQQPATIRSQIEGIIDDAYRSGRSRYVNAGLRKELIEKGIKPIVRANGARVGLKASAHAIARTRATQLAVESAVDRYRRHGIKEVEFAVGGRCTYKGEGGSCDSLHGRRWPIDDIPAWAMPPRHLYGNSRLLPVAP